MSMTVEERTKILELYNAVKEMLAYAQETWTFEGSHMIAIEKAMWPVREAARLKSQDSYFQPFVLEEDKPKRGKKK